MELLWSMCGTTVFPAGVQVQCGTGLTVSVSARRPLNVFSPCSRSTGPSAGSTLSLPLPPKSESACTRKLYDFYLLCVATAFVDLANSWHKLRVNLDCFLSENKTILFPLLNQPLHSLPTNSLHSYPPPTCTDLRSAFFSLCSL